jgi:hypothetical protein
MSPARAMDRSRGDTFLPGPPHRPRRITAIRTGKHAAATYVQVSVIALNPPRSSQAGTRVPCCATRASTAVSNDASRSVCVKARVSGSRRRHRSTRRPRTRSSRKDRPNGRTRGRLPRPWTGASPCRHAPAGRCRAPMTRSSGGSARTCRRTRGTGTRSVARCVFYPPVGWGACSAASATGAESPFAEVGDGPFGLMAAGAGAGLTVTAGRPSPSS